MKGSVTAGMLKTLATGGSEKTESLNVPPRGAFAGGDSLAHGVAV